MPEIHSKKWAQRFMSLAQHVAEWSPDPSTKVGAVVADYFRRVVATGYNGFPRGVEDTAQRYENRELKYRLTVHAEANALLGTAARGCVLYTTHFPCTDCAKLVIQSGISRVVYENPPSDRWAEDAAFSRTMLLEAGVVPVRLDVLLLGAEVAP